MNNHKQIVTTKAAPTAIGAYSQAVAVGNLVFISGQIALDPETGKLCQDSISQEIERVFSNLRAICQAAGGDLQDIVKMTVYLTDLADFAALNEVMTDYFSEPYPARAAVQVVALPKGARVEIEAILSR